MTSLSRLYPLIPFALVLSLACGLQVATVAPTRTGPPSPAPSSSSAPLPQVTEQDTLPAPAANIAVGVHLSKPPDAVPSGPLIYDVDSSGTGAEGRAPYGDSYQHNLFERPFLKNMTYVPELDILTYHFSQDAQWDYVSMQLAGSNVNGSLSIDYGVEIGLHADGFGDYLLWAQPPYNSEWDTSNLKVYPDTNHDTGGLSAERSDAVLSGNGYDKLIFDGGSSADADPDLAWVRANAGQDATIQFAFKKSWLGAAFMLGVVADGGLKDFSKFDYNDRFTEADAGSPVRSNKYYPLGALYAVDNTCWVAEGFHTTGYEPKLCPALQAKPTRKPSQSGGQVQSCDEGYTFDPSINQCVPVSP